MVRISTLDLNKVDTAVAYRTQIRERDFNNDTIFSTSENSLHNTCEDSKIISKISHKQTHLTPAEKDELVAKYKNGITMRALAELYGCHHTTVRRILKTHKIES